MLNYTTQEVHSFRHLLDQGVLRGLAGPRRNSCTPARGDAVSRPTRTGGGSALGAFLRQASAIKKAIKKALRKAMPAPQLVSLLMPLLLLFMMIP